MGDGVDLEAAVDSLADPHGLLLRALEEESHSPHHRLLIRYGISFEPEPLPSDVLPGKERCCAWNSCELATAEPESYTYFEGVATNRSGPSWPLSHAWCVDRRGRVVDRTWTSRTTRALAYRGVPLPLGVIRDLIVEESAGFLAAPDTFAMFDYDVEIVARLLGLTK
jgi:hypothetical protein